MSLTKLEIGAYMGWTQRKLIAGRNNLDVSNKIELAKVLATLTDITAIYEDNLSFTSGEVKEIDLSAFTDRSGNAIVATKAFAILLAPVGQSVSIATGTTNGLAWRAETVPDGGVSFYYQPLLKVIDGTHKVIKLTAGAAVMTCDVVVLLG